VLSLFAGTLRLASVVLCLIVIASFALFAIDQTGNASAHQQEVLSNPTTAPGGQPTRRAPAKEGGARKTIDEAADAITSPFSSATDATSSQWLIHAINLLLTLLVYGFGLAFLARVIRVRV
jgi:hypothetical protein